MDTLNSLSYSRLKNKCKFSFFLIFIIILHLKITMLKYKHHRKLIEINCDQCGKLFSKPISEYKRNTQLGRRNFCSRSCCGKSNTANLPKTPSYDISQHSDNNKDEFTGFRYYYRNSKKRFKEFNLTLQDLKDQWYKQQGICPYTGYSLVLFKPKSVTDYKLRASLDRVDSSKGYIKDNIEFISLPINYLKADKLSKEETIALLKEISLNYK